VKTDAASQSFFETSEYIYPGYVTCIYVMSIRVNISITKREVSVREVHQFWTLLRICGLRSSVERLMLGFGS